MSEATGSLVPYRVVYSERVRAELKELLTRATEAGRGPEALDAVRQLHSRLRIYPEFGQPLRDLHTEGETLWVGSVGPLVAQYIIDRDRRLVFVVVPIKALPGFVL